MAPPTRFLILSDTHNQWPYTPSSPAPKVDVLLHCGDLTQVDGLPSFRAAINNLKSIDAKLRIVIAGNHDLELDPNWCLENGDEDDVVESRRAIDMFKKEPGICYLEEGTHTFELSSGARFSVYASPYTPEFNGYAFGYRAEDRFSILPRSSTFDHLEPSPPRNPIPADVDIIMTHGPPLLVDPQYTLDYNHRNEHCGCGKLARAVARTRPMLHCFGHIHEGRGAAEVEWTEYAPLVKPLSGEFFKLSSTSSSKMKTLLVNAAMQKEVGKGIVVDIEFS